MNLNNLRLSIPAIKPKASTGTLPTLKDAGDFQALVKRERACSNRNNQKFVILAFNVESFNDDNALATEFVEYLRSRIRLTDYLGWFDDARIGVLLANTSIDGARKLLDDMATHFNGSAAMPEFSVYPYPHTGINIEAM